MNEEDAERGAIAVAICEVFILELLEKGLLDPEEIRDALESARDGIGERRPELKRTASRVFDELVQETYSARDPERGSR